MATPVSTGQISILGRSIYLMDILYEGRRWPLLYSQWSDSEDPDNMMKFSTGKGDQLFCTFLTKVL